MCSQVGYVMISPSSLVLHAKVKNIAPKYWIVLHFAYHITPSDLCQNKSLVSLIDKCWFLALVFAVTSFRSNNLPRPSKFSQPISSLKKVTWDVYPFLSSYTLMVTEDTLLYIICTK